MQRLNWVLISLPRVGVYCSSLLEVAHLSYPTQFSLASVTETLLKNNTGVL